MLDKFKKFDRSMPIVTETEQVADRRNFYLNSRTEISDGSARRFCSLTERAFLNARAGGLRAASPGVSIESAARKTAAAPLQAMWQMGPPKFRLWFLEYSGVVGAGADFALNDKWSSRIEYLFIDYANRDIAFPSVADSYHSSLAVQTIRIGLDYKLGEKTVDPDVFTKSLAALELDRSDANGPKPEVAGDS